MGFSKDLLDFIQECVNDSFGGLKGKRMLELGNQECSKGIPEKTGKEYFSKRGLEHTSFDLNGLDGTLVVDLSKPMDPSRWDGYFDIITNSGTTEHVEPKEAQYVCFANIHNWLKPGGVAIHLVPDADELKRRGAWRFHCNNYYSKAFFEMLARNNDYKLVSFKIIEGLSCACLQKRSARPFMEEREEFLKHITRKWGGSIYSGINDRGTFLWLTGFLQRSLKRIPWLYRPLARFVTKPKREG